jgi:hypothetical protein
MNKLLTSGCCLRLLAVEKSDQSPMTSSRGREGASAAYVSQSQQRYASGVSRAK